MGNAGETSEAATGHRCQYHSAEEGSTAMLTKAAAATVGKKLKADVT